MLMKTTAVRANIPRRTAPMITKDRTLPRILIASQVYLSGAS